ncbi:Tetraspanin family-domain-containing protein [Halteromyces radiatus]|uniref:Tetraspanin family-domain-containing protein n=1 Tax=Halteromyces radiatus TaxID=101107 RepID=UPI0022204E9D|nr:Tetraspanin family-domain-containing protein [Halteromyces radiatus]KAI8078722.1 Tetraspanin family-domain-containing protein [Halteromyces radiatus]
MTTCCGRLSKVYVILTNLLFACLGAAYIAFGVLGSRNKFLGAALFPDLVFKLSAILGAIIIVASIFGFTAAFSRRRLFIYLYLLVILISLAVQVVIGVQVYKSAANTKQYLVNFWASASDNDKTELQNEFSCCGYDGIQSSTSNQCPTSLPPCFDSLQTYIQNAFQKVYLITFAALAVQLLAISNAMTMICSRYIHSDQYEDERREHRKSGIRLDDMTVDTPTTAGSYNQYGMHQQQYEQKGYYVDNSPQNRYDSYDMYRHNNASSGYANQGYNQYHY